ncbi:hypothetical protein KTJ40_01410 [Acinetobacter ursingii]|uniref:Carboxypeptidase regulatory-like domain-containing protein n=2 Tax=Acinetobacter ursingii TaxID=108980 RepID=A0A3D2SSI9_9GAMM|nr:hypothetical protein [Acinetobacter ursingii]MCU4608221.1 hypothetical protein [Acinetobacter ursingii]HCK31792.1 hypothetical protein [Acinetobacter ursingii]
MVNCDVNLLLLTQLKQTVVSGKTMELGKPVSRSIRAYSRLNGALIKTTQSNENGEYKIYLPHDVAYTMVSIDPNKKFNAVIQDNVVPK